MRTKKDMSSDPLYRHLQIGGGRTQKLPTGSFAEMLNLNVLHVHSQSTRLFREIIDLIQPLYDSG